MSRSSGPSGKDGDNTRRGNQGAVNNPPQPGPSHDQDKYSPAGVVNEWQQPGPAQQPGSSAVKSPGGPGGSEVNRGPARPKPVGGFSPADEKRGWTDNERNPEAGSIED